MTKFLYLIIITAALILPGPGNLNAQERLVKIVALSRHGVRAPTQSDKVLKLWSKKTWPVWPVRKGDLTPRGAKLVTAMWQNMREQLEKETIIPENLCSHKNSVYVRADVDERTRATAYALIKGLAPDCSLGYNVAEGDVDPLFHPVKAGLYKYNPVPTATAILSMTDGGLQELQENFSGALNLLDKISGPPSEQLCERFSLGTNCNLSDLPNAISIGSDGNSAHLIGALSIASSMAEVFLLEYGEWPGVAAGWGQVNASTLAQLLPVHSKIFDVVNRAPIISWANGSALLKDMTDALLSRHSDSRINEARLVIFVGHDTNLANIGALLDINWQAIGYPPNGIPPAAVLFLELWEVNGQEQIRIKFFAQPPKALHAPFSNDTMAEKAIHAPLEARTTIKPIVGAAWIDMETFLKMLGKAIEGAPLVFDQKTVIQYEPVAPSE